MSTDPSAALAAIRERHTVVAAANLNPDAFGGGVYAAVVRLAQEDTPSLVAALEVVLKAHRPNTADGRCNWCRDPDGQRSAFPCGEYLSITAALTGEERSDEH